VSVSLNKVAAAARARGDLAAAERLFAESPEISPAPAKELDTPEARRDLALCRLYLAGIAETRGRCICRSNRNSGSTRRSGSFWSATADL
jgi:hypothetical protein